nr:type I-B CRISPR-associated protein Cas5b [Candidatus Freyarchaeota archaeon]
MIPVIVFDIWGDFAHFKKGYTTTSPISFGIPPRTTIAGIIAAIMGFDRREYYKKFTLSDSKISLKLINPLKRIQLTESLAYTKEGFFPYRISFNKDDNTLALKPFRGENPHILVRIDFIKNPKYRIYFYHNNSDIMEKLETLLKEHKSVYTPYLGLSELIANFEYIGTLNSERIEVSPDSEEEGIEINSIAPLSALEAVDVAGTWWTRNRDAENSKKPKNKLAIDNVPIYINQEREAEKFGKIIYDEECKLFKVKPKSHYWKLENGENILYFSNE